MSFDIKDAADFPSLVSISSERLQQLELFEMRAELDTRTVAGQQQEIQKLQEALDAERAHNARYSDIVMRMGRDGDELAAQREMRHAAVVAGLNREVASKNATIADMAASQRCGYSGIRGRKCGSQGPSRCKSDGTHQDRESRPHV
jgi:hypothetical protein